MTEQFTAGTFTFLHGMNNDAQVWSPVIAALGDAVDRTYAPDLPALQTVEEIADAVARDAPRGIVVGHSFGGAVAMALLERHPELVTGLVLVASSLGADTAEQARDRVTKAERFESESDYVDFAVKLMPKVYHPANVDDAELRDERRRSVGVYGLERYRAHSRAIGVRPDRTGAVRATAVPVLVIAPESDTVIPPERQERFAGEVGADSRTITGAGHMLPAERPSGLAAVVADWVRTVSDS